MRSYSSFAVAALSLQLAVNAQSIAKTCPQTGVCFSLNIPDATAKSGDGAIFFQITAPTSLQWVALGQGSSMSGANIFVMYTSANGNVTISPRLGTGHVEPEHDTAAKIALLAGSGVSGNTMTANIRCDNCQKWSGGSMDFTTTSGNFIYAYKTGSSLNSDDPSAEISYHDGHDNFAWQFATAQGGDGSNPFISSNNGATGSAGSATKTLPPCTPAAVTQTLAQPSGSGCPTAWPTEFSSRWPTARPTWAASCFPSGYGPWPTNAPWNNDHSNQKRGQEACDDGSGSASGSPEGNPSSGDSDSATFSHAGAPFGGDITRGNRIIQAHGVLAALAFVALFPAGGLLIRLTSLSLWIHAGVQIVAFVIYIVALGLGIYIAMQTDQIGHAHPIVGIVLFILLLFQPLSGTLHHKMFVRYGRRTAWSYEHLGIGRIAIVLGIVNGGLGIQLAGDVSSGGKVAYAVCGTVMAVLYLAGIVYGEIRRRNTVSPGHDQIQKRQSRALGSEDGDAPIEFTEHFATKTERR